MTVDYLATNPANRTAGAGLKHVGMALLGVAIARSIELGFGVRLESLPAAETFYQGLGMAKQAHPSQEGNAVYVLQPEPAKQLLEEIEKRRILEL